MARLLFIVNDPAFFLSHWRAVQDRVRDAGYDVHVAAADGRAAETIRSLGFTFHPLPLSRDNRNPLAELRLILAIARLVRRVTPDLVHMVTIKPVLWGGLVCRFFRKPAVSYISGLGYVTLAPSRLLRSFVRTLYPIALGGARRRIVFENEDDRATLSQWGVNAQGRSEIIAGAGVDLARFAPTPEPEGNPVVLMPARMLIDKGARDYIDAAKLLAQRGVHVSLRYAGQLDPAYPNAIGAAELQDWQDDGHVAFLGHIEDMPDALRRAHIVALPSYREGLPLALIEAAAAGKPIITTDVPGCRAAVIDGTTGRLVPPRDPQALADAIEHLAAAPYKRRAMGLAARALAEERFGLDAIADAHLTLYRAMLAGD